MKVTNPRRIALARRKRGYTQADLAALVGCTQQYISMLEGGADTDCSERLALAICKRLDIELEDAFEERPIFSDRPIASNKVGSKGRAA